MTNGTDKICILGGGFGGLYTALYLAQSALARSGKCQITLVEQKERFLFTPLLYELMTGELQPWQIAPTYEKLIKDTKIRFCQATIRGLQLSTREVMLENGEKLNYDYLVLAVGNQNRWVKIPGLETHALTFRTLADAERLQARLRQLEGSGREKIRLAIVGGGPNGVELACKLADRLGKMGEVKLIETGDDILSGFSRGVKRAAYRALSRRNVRMELQTTLGALETDSMTLTCGDRTNSLPVDLVIWAAGTEAREWVRNLDCQQSDRGKLLTRRTLQLVDYPEVFALGDLADIPSTKQPVPATAQAAYQQASCTAKNLKAAMRGKRLQPFRYLHLGDMLTLGKGAAVVSSFFLNLEGKLASFIRQLVYIQRLPTWHHRLQVLRHLLKRSMIKGLRWINGLYSSLLPRKLAKARLKSPAESKYNRR